MYYSKKNKILFIHNQKCAGRSIKVFLRKTLGNQSHLPKECNHWGLSQLSYYMEDDFSDFFKITSVRNPWDRIVSYYYHLKKHYPNLHCLKSFGTFCSKDNLKKLMLQRKICVNGKLKMDFCLRVENIEEDIDNLMKEMSVKNYQEIRKEDHGTIRRKNYKDCYTTSTKKIIADVFAWEIEKFNYKF